jgi:hypothetical protein
MPYSVTYKSVITVMGKNILGLLELLFFKRRSADPATSTQSAI